MMIAELCAGYGGLTLALQHLTPARLVWYAETDPDASTVLAAHHPDVPNHGDITTVDWTAAEPVDVLAAGFPCQPFSTAGRRRGTADEHHLWPTGVLPAITALDPTVVVLENVPGLLTVDNGAVFRQILTDLDRLGYTIRWTTIGACKIGLCHHRHRVYIHATRVVGELPYEIGMPIGSWATWPRDGVCSAGMVWALVSDVCGTSGVVLPTPCASDGGSRGTGLGTYTDPGGRPLREVIAMLPTPGARLGDQHGQPTPALAEARIGSGRRNLWGRWATAVAHHASIIGRPAPPPTITGSRGGLRLNPQLTEWMMGLPAGWITDVLTGPNACNRLAGNGVVPQSAALAICQLTGGLIW